jgi:hypothetical protein
MSLAMMLWFWVMASKFLISSWFGIPHGQMYWIITNDAQKYSFHVISLFWNHNHIDLSTHEETQWQLCWDNGIGWLWGYPALCKAADDLQSCNVLPLVIFQNFTIFKLTNKNCVYVSCSFNILSWKRHAL